ncbi:hypothetical protein BT63DRAFT_449043 [Microthyrium microscopicum]|uniref:Heterokaryon incompatibility domain-containing protein n=1 Tax=Microthyrium microscopicum TaxID=703497 RepID=A0A6A6USW6_9PEZI|nr:hypothetical protein BT63DRAFT_449043 [Microthyrium microscopicum]
MAGIKSPGSGTIESIDCLTISHPFQATDPRDKIYCLSCLSQYDGVGGIPVDYDCSTEDLYTRVAARILSESHSLDILYSNLGKRTLHLPSWVTDWSTWQVASQGTAFNFVYRACGSTICEFRVDSDRLEVARCQRTWLNEQLQLAQSTEPYVTGVDISEVLWRTLIGNISLDEEEAEEEEGQNFEALQSFSESSFSSQKQMAKTFVDAVRRRSRYRRFCVTHRGYFAGVPEQAEVGDWISSEFSSSPIVATTVYPSHRKALNESASRHPLAAAHVPPPGRSRHSRNGWSTCNYWVAGSIEIRKDVKTIAWIHRRELPSRVYKAARRLAAWSSSWAEQGCFGI